MEEKYKCIGIVSLYLQVVQWFLRVGLLPERAGAFAALPYPAHQLYHIYNKRYLQSLTIVKNIGTALVAQHYIIDIDVPSV